MDKHNTTKLNYKDFIAEIDYDERDHIFVGRVQGLDAKHLLSFHGSSKAELQAAFADSIDLYLGRAKDFNVIGVAI